MHNTRENLFSVKDSSILQRAGLSWNENKSEMGQQGEVEEFSESVGVQGHLFEKLKIF